MVGKIVEGFTLRRSTDGLAGVTGEGQAKIINEAMVLFVEHFDGLWD